MYAKLFRFHVLSLPLVALMLLTLVALALSAPGDLDPSFGTDGKVTTDFNGSYDEGHAVAIQADGKIVVAGTAYTGSSYDFAVARYNSDGSLDASFGTDGKVATDFCGPNEPDQVFAVAIQADGKIVAAGVACSDFGVARYNSDGSLDTSFGTGGKVVTGFYGAAWAVAIQADGKIVVAGWTGSVTDFALARYNSDGSLDASFGTGGKVTADFNGSHDNGRAVVIQADGKIVVAGTAYTGNISDFALARYNSDGSLDTSFGIGGKVITDFNGVHDMGYAGAIQADGKIVVAGLAYTGNRMDFAVARYNSDGSLDTPFGSGGKVTTDFNGNAYGWAVAIQADSKIVMAGSAVTGNTTDFAVARYNSDGSLDASFGSGGKVATDFDGFHDNGRAVAIQADGKIVVAGYRQEVGTGNQGAIQGDDKIVDVAVIYGADGVDYTPEAGAIQSTDRIIDFAVARYGGGINEPPVNEPPVVDAGGPYIVDEGGSVLLTASGSDPDGHPLTFAWDLDNDGVFETPGQSVTFSAAGIDGPSSRTIAVRVSDSGGLSATDQTAVTILRSVTPVACPVTAGGWNEVGTGSACAGGVNNNNGAPWSPSIASDGTPYVAWQDASSGNYAIYVRRWNGSSWEEVGAGSASGGGISNSGGSDPPSIAVAPDGTPYITWSASSSGNGDIYIRRWNGGSWEEVGAGSASGGGISNDSNSSWSPSIAIAPDGTPYVAWRDYSGWGHNTEIFVRRWNGSSWEEVGAGSASGSVGM